MTSSQRRDVLEIIDERYGRGSTLITSQLRVASWFDIVGDPSMADAILDRLVRNAHNIALEGKSIRKTMKNRLDC